MEWEIELDVVVLSQGAATAAQDFAAQAKALVEQGLAESQQQVQRPAAPESSVAGDGAGDDTAAAGEDSIQQAPTRSQRESDPRVSYVYRVTSAVVAPSADDWRSIVQATSLRGE
jgi:hypothetical protein